MVVPNHFPESKAAMRTPCHHHQCLPLLFEGISGLVYDIRDVFPKITAGSSASHLCVNPPATIGLCVRARSLRMKHTTAIDTILPEANESHDVMIPSTLHRLDRTGGKPRLSPTPAARFEQAAPTSSPTGAAKRRGEGNVVPKTEREIRYLLESSPTKSTHLNTYFSGSYR